MDDIFNKFILDMREKYFIWGELDCVLFGCQWAKLYTGNDPAEGHYGLYSDEKTAFKYLKTNFGDFKKGFDLYYKQVDPDKRIKGDIALCNYKKENIVGVCGDNGFIYFKAKPKGIFAKRNATVLNAWRLK